MPGPCIPEQGLTVIERWALCLNMQSLPSIQPDKTGLDPVRNPYLKHKALLLKTQIEGIGLSILTQ